LTLKAAKIITEQAGTKKEVEIFIYILLLRSYKFEEVTADLQNLEW
jgi:hypothetical protein